MVRDRPALEPATEFTVASSSRLQPDTATPRNNTMLLEHDILETIQKLSRQLDYSCKDCPASEHSDLLQSVIEDLKAQLEESVSQRPAYQD